MAESNLYYKYEKSDNLTPIGTSPQDTADFLEELSFILTLDIIDAQQDEEIMQKIEECEAIPWDVEAYYSREFIKVLKKRQEPIQKAFIRELASLDYLTARNVNQTIVSVIDADDIGGELYKMDMAKAKNLFTLPQSNALPRICRQMQTWFNLEDIPPFYAVIVARAIYSYYKAYKPNKGGEQNITARKINYIIKDESKKQESTFSSIEKVINKLATLERLPIYKTKHGIIDRRKGTKTDTWATKKGYYWADYRLMHKEEFTNFEEKIDFENFKQWQETYKKLEKEASTYAKNKIEKEFISFMPSCVFISLDQDLLFFSADLCGTVKQTCIYYYLALVITEARNNTKDIVKVNLQTLYELLQIEDTSANNKSKVIKFVADEVIPKWKAQNIVQDCIINKTGKKYTDIEITLV